MQCNVQLWLVMFVVYSGVDDALALLLAFSMAKRDAECEIIAITTVFGNTTLQHVNRNVATLLKYASVTHIPVYHGAASAMVVPPPPEEEESFHGYDMPADKHEFDP